MLLVLTTCANSSGSAELTVELDVKGCDMALEQKVRIDEIRRVNIRVFRATHSDLRGPEPLVYKFQDRECRI